MLGANGDMGRVGLHTSLDKEEWGTKRRLDWLVGEQGDINNG